MIEGQVTVDREMLVPLTVLDALSNEVELEAILDTGFTEFLTLAPDVVHQLSLPRIEITPMTLANGTTVWMAVHEARVLWDGQERTIPVHVADGPPLLGVALLYGNVVTLEVVDGGRVIIETYV